MTDNKTKNIDILKAKQQARIDGTYIKSLQEDQLNKIENDRNTAIAKSLIKDQARYFYEAKDRAEESARKIHKEQSTLSVNDYVKPFIIIVAFFALSIPVCFSVMDLVL